MNAMRLRCPLFVSNNREVGPKTNLLKASKNQILTWKRLLETDTRFVSNDLIFSVDFESAIENAIRPTFSEKNKNCGLFLSLYLAVI